MPITPVPDSFTIPSGSTLQLGFGTPRSVPPSISSQPTAQSAQVGGTATFSVTVSGTAPFTYQWSKNGVAITGATLNSYTTPALLITDNAASYTVTVTNPYGFVTSSGALLTVTAVVDTTPPVFTGTLSVSNVTSSSYTVAWPTATDNVGVTGYEYSLNNGTSWTSVGVATSTLVAGRTSGTTDTFQVRAFDAAGNRSTPVLSTNVLLLTSTTGNLNTSFTLTSAVTSTAVPFSIGHAFKQGDIPSGSGVVVSGSSANAQVVTKNTWPDGSVKFAIISGTASLVANTPSTVNLASGSPSGGISLTTTDLKAALTLPVTVDAGVLGSASWSGTDWDIPFQTWISGPRMSSWIYRKPVGTDPHLVAWLEVKLFVSGDVEVLPWIENGYIRVAGAINKSATYTFTMGGTARFSALIDLPSHNRTPLISGAYLTHWLGADPGVVPKHNQAYLMSTKMVPNYKATVAPTALVVTGLASTFAPLQLSNHTAAMPSTGYHPDIGILPEWDVVYLTTTANSAYGGLIRNAYSSGRWGIHYRDEVTNRPLKFSSFPNLSTNSSTILDYPVGATGTSNNGWDVPHHPSLGYLAYLVTGHFYHLETLQFAATYNYLFQTDNIRQFAGGVFVSSSGASTVRGAAWANRTLAQVAAITPDADPLKSEFIASLEANISWNHARYVAQVNNPYGIVQPYGNYTAGSGVWSDAAWQHDFYTAAFGYMLSLNPSISSLVKTKLTDFFTWKAQSSIGRLGGTSATEWLYRDATPYTFVVAMTETVDWVTGTGPWPTSWGAMYDATYATAGLGARATGPLRGGYFPDATSYWGNFMPGISYAVEHNVAGASTAYLRMANEVNFNQLETSFNTSPVWSVEPRNDPRLPAWVTALPLNQWYEIPNTALSSVAPNPVPMGNNGPASKMQSWCGATLKRAGSVYMLGNAGGHNDYGGNEVDAIVLNTATPQWQQLRAPTPDIQIYNSSQFYADLRPSATHTYYATQFIESKNRMLVFCSAGFSLGANPPANWPYGGSTRTASFNLGTNDWDPPDYITPRFTDNGDWIACLCCKHPYTDDVYYSRSYSDGFYKWTASTNTWSKTSTTTATPWYAGSAVDPVRGHIFYMGGYTPNAPGVLDLNGNYVAGITFGGLGVSAITVSGYPAVVYDEALDCFWGMCYGTTNARLLKINAATFEVTEPTTSGIPPINRLNGFQNSLQYVPELKGIVIADQYLGNLKFMRTSL